MFRTTKALTLAALSASLLWATGCTDDAAISVTNNDPGTNNRTENPDPDVPNNSKLLHVTPCDPGETTCVVPITDGSRVDLEVKLVDGTGEAVPNRAVKFDLATPVEAVGTTINAANAVTNNSGIAKIQLTGGSTPGTANITVSTSDESVDPIRFTVVVNSKDSAFYEVEFNHPGSAQISHLDVYLYAPDVTCDELAEDFARERDGNSSTHPQLTAEYTRRGLVNADGSIPNVIFPDIRNGEAFSVAAKGYSIDNAEVEVTYGCQADNPPVTNGQPVTVIVDLDDHLPHIVGTYNVTHTFDLRDALPENIRNIVDIIGRVATDPASFLLGCPAGDANCNGGSDGLLHVLLDLDFLPEDLRNSIESFLNNNLANSLLRDAVNDIFNSWLADSAPDWVKNTVDITADIYNTLKTFRVEGKLFINEPPVAQPDQNGDIIYLLPEDSGRQLWNTLIFYWSRGCEGQPESCSIHRIASNQLGSNSPPIEGTFSGAILAADQLEIYSHTLTLNYGLILMTVVERVVLPAIFGPGVDSIDRMIDELMRQTVGDCTDLASKVSDPGSTTHNVVKNLCNNLIQEASDGLRRYVTENLVLTGDDHFLLGTPEGEPCTLYQPGNYVGTWPNKPLPYVEGLGKAEPENLQCKWDVRLRFSQGGDPVRMDGTFHGTLDR